MQKVDRNKDLRQRALKDLLSISRDDQYPIKNLVFATTEEKATKYLESMVEKMDDKDIKYISRFMGDIRFGLVNGDTYQVVSATDGCKGYRCDRVFVDNGIDLDILNQVIRPRICGSKLSKEEQIVYFD